MKTSGISSSIDGGTTGGFKVRFRNISAACMWHGHGLIGFLMHVGMLALLKVVTSKNRYLQRKFLI